MATRAAQLEALSSRGSDPSAPLDVLVIGGGVTGAGIARDAAYRGLSVGLAEMEDLAFGTSSRSSKLVHGGLRYLEQYQFGLVFEALSERHVLQTIAPHLVRPLGFLFPVYAGQRQKLWLIQAGMWLYDGLSMFRAPHRSLAPPKVAEVEPTLTLERLRGAPLYWDCATDDARLTLETAVDAARSGAAVATYCRVEELLHGADGRVCGARVHDRLGGRRFDVHARAVVNATGPWTDRVLAMGSGTASSVLRPTKGVHLVVDHAKLPVQHAVVCFHPEDGRVLFAIPWGDRTYVGTTDTDETGDPGAVRATAEDVDYLIDASNAYFPAHPLRRQDILSTWAGVRPLMAPQGRGEGVAESSVSREHQILTSDDGLITIAGGKLTTYRRMAAECVDTALAQLARRGTPVAAKARGETAKAPLPGAEAWPEGGLEAVVAQVREAAPLPEATATLLARTYGTRAVEVAARAAESPALAAPIVRGRPEILAQVDHAVEEEMAACLADVFVRRTQLFFRDRDQALGAEAARARMAELLGWDAEERARQAEAYRREVAHSRAWREDDARQTPAPELLQAPAAE
jgi:glycerol-3-phosphate dehydrogenase